MQEVEVENLKNEQDKEKIDVNPIIQIEEDEDDNDFISKKQEK